MTKFFYKIKYFLLDTFFPNKCINCGKTCDFLCKNCLNLIHKVSLNECLFCKNKCNFGICKKCSLNKHFDGIFCLFNYRDVKNLLKDMKYNGFYDICRFFGEILGDFYVENNINSYFKNYKILLVPVPMHKKRLKKRGYNQTLKISEAFSYKTKINIYDKILFRTRNTIKQATLSEKERRKNLKGVFGCNLEKISNLDIENSVVLLLDDVITTGSTLSECSICLRKYGFKKVYVIAIAKA
ncbi:ComF family protein [Patescibacteria group bacterium]|nr:ComF family protein [Patescibacteria group bacterium]